MTLHVRAKVLLHVRSYDFYDTAWYDIIACYDTPVMR